MLTRNVVGRWGWVATGLTLGSLLTGACGSKDDEPPPGTGTGNTGNTANSTGRGGSAGKGGSAATGGSAGTGGTSDGGTSDGGTSGDTGTAATGDTGTGGTGGTDAAAPVVEITSPVAEKDPNGKGVVVTEQVDVVCEAKRSSDKGAADVDPSSVLIDMLDADEKVVDSIAATEGATGVFTARLITTKVADNGVLRFRCTASDFSNPVRTGSDTIKTFVDHGPAIEFSEPAEENEPIALGQALKIKFTVKEQPVAKGDNGAKIGDVSLNVRDVPIDLDETDGEYTATVHLDDGELFPNPPDGSLPIIVEAGNRRKPTPAVREETRHAIVDSTGPSVTIEEPADNPSVQGGKVTLVFKAIDTQSGVDPDSIVVTLNHVPYRYSSESHDWSVDDDTYRFSFDMAQQEGSVVQATVAVTASDVVGNPSAEAAIVIYLDNIPPIVDLDPPPVRETVAGSTDCSLAFDPVGPASANDLATVYQLQKFRALVWDRTNVGSGQTILYFSGPDVNSVVIRLQPNVDEGLLIDTNSDGICDELVEEDASSDPQPLPFLPLTGISPQLGGAWYGSESDDLLKSEFPLPMGCTYQNSTTPPARLCPPQKADDMWRVITWDVDDKIPAIFGIGSLAGIACTGTDWEIGPMVQEGWICVAGRAEDNVGNVGISRPLRLCFDDGVGPPPACAGSNPEPPPSCRVNDCALPPAFPQGYMQVHN